jgi:hypothetical protein
MISLLGVAALTATQSGAGESSHFVIDKVVEGTQPDGAEYRISFSCVEENQPPDPQQVVINGPGNVVDAMIPIGQVGVTCTVTEPVDGGATSVTFSCEASGGAACEGDSRVEFPDNETGEGRIIVTNTFEEPTPPPEPEPAFEAIEVTPVFTG